MVRYFTGIVEAGGGLLLLVPRATYAAVAMLAAAMIGALLTHILLMGLQPATGVVIVLLFGVLSIGWRYRRRQSAPTS